MSTGSMLVDLFLEYLGMEVRVATARSSRTDPISGFEADRDVRILSFPVKLQEFLFADDDQSLRVK